MLKMKIIFILVLIAIPFSKSFAQESQHDLLFKVLTELGKMSEQNEAITKKMTALENKIIDNESLKLEINRLKHRMGSASGWPKAINCGYSWDALYVLHGNPKTETEAGLAWYVQVYPNEYRYVRFNSNGSYHDRAGHNESSIGCNNKSINQLRKESRTFNFISE